MVRLSASSTLNLETVSSVESESLNSEALNSEALKWFGMSVSPSFIQKSKFKTNICEITTIFFPARSGVKVRFWEFRNSENVLWISFARGILTTGTLDLGFGDRFFGKFPSNPRRIQGHSHTRWILAVHFRRTHGFRISDLTVGRVTFDTGFLQATCSSDLFDPFFERVVGFSVFLDADLGRAKDTSSTTVAGYVLAMGTVLNSVDEHTILNGGGMDACVLLWESQCLHFSSVLGPRASVVFNHHRRLFLRFLQLQGAGNILKLGNNHLMKSAVISQELQLGILSNRVKTMSKKEEESKLEGEPSFLTHLESKRPAEEYSPVTILPPNLWIALLFNVLMKPSAKEKQNMVESVFDDNVQTSIIKVIFKDEFDFKKHYENLCICLFNFSFNILHNANTLEITYRKAFVNPLILKAFDDLNDKIRFQIREIESKLCKRFLEVVGNAMAEDITGYYGDMEKLFKAMQILIFYQHHHHLTCDVSEDQLPCIQSFGLLVYFTRNITEVQKYSPSDKNLLEALS
ncbi:hypothetical protein RhiirA4_481088 [Rhizophagus irregularis]|uniref:Uncharacterized protein n=1 Tax=Rhizophagus irregularis TaxID=588596 RepID=A0A2I1HIZ9_9GLOM|nr:hypothetical protein RhiirA4_481088 [Rhizophagus irregularis]